MILLELEETDIYKAQLGLGHAFSRMQVQYDINRQDKSIIQAIAVIDQYDKDINTFSMRLKEWFSWHFPELQQIVSDLALYVKIVNQMGNRNNMNSENRDELQQITLNESITDQIIDAGKISMGQDITETDESMVKNLSGRIKEMIEYRDKIQEYLKNRMSNICPNLTEVVGENIGARLISHSGSLVNLAKLPASTIQILGAEKALFRALKTRGNTPKYGIIYHTSILNKSSKENKGKMSRGIANKLAMASRIDQFALKQNNCFGLKFKEQLEERLRLIGTKEKPQKNDEVMAELIKDLIKEGKYVQPEKNSEKIQEDQEEQEEIKIEKKRKSSANDKEKKERKKARTK